MFILFFSLLGTKFIGNMDGEVEYDKYSENFNDVFTSSTILYCLLSMEGYPDVA